jgi:hypothetical protein
MKTQPKKKRKIVNIGCPFFITPPLFSDFSVHLTYYKGLTFGISCFLSLLLPTFFVFQNGNAIIHLLKK